MTQPVSPGIVFNERGPAQFNSLEGSRGGANPLAAPVPIATPGALPDGGLDFDAIHARESALAAQREQVDTEQARLEAEHGKGETALTQFARGALSALLAPGAIQGAAFETAGKALGALVDPLVPDDIERRYGIDPARNIGARALEDFGRSLGKASTGRAALEVAGGLADFALSGGDIGAATSAADAARIAVDEQEKAWPLLSAASQIGGGLAFGLATGGLAGSLPSTAKGLAAVGAVEGASAGAQAAYDVDAPLTEVWSSAIMGATLGAGLGAASTVPGKVIQKFRGGQGLAKVFGEGETLSEFAEGRVAKSLGFSKRLYKKYGEDEVSRIARDIDELHLADGTPVFPKNVIEAARMDRSDIAERLVQAHEEVGAEIGALRARASQFIDDVAPDLRPSPTMLASRIESEVAQPLAQSVSEADRAAARYLQKTAQNFAEMGDSAPLEAVVAARQRIGAELGDKFQTTGAQIDAMKRVYGIIQDDLAQRFEIAAQGMGEAGSAYRGLNRKYTSIERALEAMEDGVAAQKGNNMLGLSSNIVMAGTFASDMATGGSMSALKALGAGVGHKLIQERGPQIMAALTRRFARTQAAVDVAEAGGKEAQEALTAIMRARKFIQETGESAGPNPAVSAVGENTAQEVVSKELERLAGDFDPRAWATSPRAPSPLARVLYRSPILDTVSQDLAQTVEKSAALRPSLDFTPSPQKLARLTRDADGPQAIGLVQQRVRELADTFTHTAPEAIPVLEQSLARLETADVAGAMTEAHDIARQLSAAGAPTEARAMLQTLGDDAFGSAGKLYRQMTAAPSEALDDLANPTKLREALKTLELRGEFTQQIAAEHASTIAAYEARKKLTGEAIPDGLKKQMQAIEDAWSRGEEAVTLDGTRFGRIVDHLDNTTESKVVSSVPRVPEQQQVAEVVKGGLKELEPLLRRTGRAIAQGAIKGAGRMTRQERLAQYEQRLDTLAQYSVQPDTEQQTAALSQAPQGVRTAATMAMQQKLENLRRDMPKPPSDIHGTAYDSMSSDDLRLSDAYWTATMEPMSVFKDFARGNIDPDKASYAWKQYPGLQQLSQLGFMDRLNQMSAAERNALPDNLLTQMDSLLGFNGAVQATVSVAFSQRMSAVGDQLAQQQSAPTPPSRGLVLPTSKPTMTQRIAGAQ